MSTSDKPSTESQANDVCDIADDSPTANRVAPDFSQLEAGSAGSSEQQVLESELAALIRSRDELARRNQDLTSDLQALRELASNSEKTLQAKTEELHEALIELQDLKCYTEGRNSEWSALREELASQRRELQDAQDTLSRREGQVAVHDEEKATLTARILELQEKLAEVSGRSTAIAGVESDLRDQVTAQAAELERLKISEAAAVRERDSLIENQEDSADQVRAVQDELEQRDLRITELEKQAQEDRADLREAHAKAEHAEYLAQDVLRLKKKVTDLEAALGEARAAPQESASSADIYREALAQEEEKLRVLTAERDELLARVEQSEADSPAGEEAPESDTELEADFQETVAGLCEQLEEAAAEIRQKDVQVATVLGEAEEQKQLAERLREELQAARRSQQDLEAEAARHADVREALGESRDQLAALRDDLSRKQEIIDLLDNSIRRLEADDGAPLVEQTRVELPSLPADEARPETAVACIEMLTPGAWAERFPLHDAVVTIGRGSRCDIRLARDQISRQHARLTVGDEGTIIEDLGSKNGVFINGRRVNRCGKLQHADVVRLADVELQFVDPSQA